MKSHKPVWRAGFGKRDITPENSVWLSGFAARDHPSEKVLHPIYAKAMALMDSTNKRTIIVSAEILGFSRSVSRKITKRISTQFGIKEECVFLSATHSHSSPVVDGVLPLIYNFSDLQRRMVKTYTAFLIEAIVVAVEQALDDMQPGSLEFRQGAAGIGVNRRRCRPGQRHLPGPVDPDVPVLVIRNSKKRLRGLIFGYACHTTALYGYEISGDYAGFACLNIEAAYPDSMALFIPGCAGDINPLPRGTTERAELHGRILSEAVLDVISKPGRILTGPLHTLQSTVPLRFEHLPTLKQLRLKLASTEFADKWAHLIKEIVPPEQRLEKKVVQDTTKALITKRRDRIQYQIEYLIQRGYFPRFYNLPVGILNFGQELRWIHIGGEPVVDYSLALKERLGWEETWVSGYFYELAAYIPSLRVLQEGGYEGEDAMWEYGHPSRFHEEIERIILKKIQTLLSI